MIKAVIFDMDGTLVDSLRYWYQAEIDVFKKVGLKMTYEMCQQKSGSRIDEVIDYWYQKSPWTKFSKEEIYQELVNKVEIMLMNECTKMPGVDGILEFVKSKGVKIALTSSSPMKLIEIVLQKLEIGDKFDQICSAEFEKRGKPNPEIYLKAAKLINVVSDECLAFEDSINGVLAAKAAKMKCVAVPDKAELNDPRFSIADIILPSLADFDESVWQKLNQ